MRPLCCAGLLVVVPILRFFLSFYFFGFMEEGSGLFSSSMQCHGNAVCKCCVPDMYAAPSSSPPFLLIIAYLFAFDQCIYFAATYVSDSSYVRIEPIFL